MILNLIDLNGLIPLEEPSTGSGGFELECVILIGVLLDELVTLLFPKIWLELPTSSLVVNELCY